MCEGCGRDRNAHSRKRQRGYDRSPDDRDGPIASVSHADSPKEYGKRGIRCGNIEIQGRDVDSERSPCTRITKSVYIYMYGRKYFVYMLYIYGIHERARAHKYIRTYVCMYLYVCMYACIYVLIIIRL